MIKILFILLGLVYLCGLFCIYMLHRNTIVYKELNRLIDENTKLAQQDIFYNRSYEWRYNCFTKKIYTKMMWQLFKFKWSLHDIYEG